jgi:phosphohistidine phosphatase SixA
VSEGPISGAALVEALEQGGYVLVFRHAATDQTQVDEFAAALRAGGTGGDLTPPDDCARQRNLNQAGRVQSGAIGEAFRRLGIRGEVITSPYCRTRETAQLAFGNYRTEAALSMVLDADVDRTTVEAGRGIIVARVPAGSNRILIMHTPNMVAMGLPLIAEGEAVILQTDGFTWRVVGQVKADEWALLP